MQSKFHITVAAVAVNSQGEHLLVREAPEGLSVYNQPAGHLEPGESLLDAVVREVREETCRPFTPEHLLGIYQWQNAHGETFIRHCFVGQIGQPLADCQLDPDIEAAEYIDPRAITDGTIALRSPLIRRAVADYQAGIRYPLEILQHVV